MQRTSEEKINCGKNTFSWRITPSQAAPLFDEILQGIYGEKLRCQLPISISYLFSLLCSGQHRLNSFHTAIDFAQQFANELFDLNL